VCTLNIPLTCISDGHRLLVTFVAALVTWLLVSLGVF